MIITGSAGYFSLGYVIEREDFFALFTAYSLTLLSFAGLFIFLDKTGDQSFILTAGLIFRFIFIFSIPALSPDVYRFIWDGKLVSDFINPFLTTPSEFSAYSDLQAQSIKKMTALSYNNYSCYPPLNQFLFVIPGFLGLKEVKLWIIAYRILLILSDVSVFYSGIYLLRMVNLPVKNIMIYFLNPMVIIEITGNLHFEGIMIALLLSGLLLLTKRKFSMSAILIGLSASVKLITLILLPFLWRQMKLKRFISYAAVCLTTFIVLFIPFASFEALKNFAESLNLYFSHFEFNASIYYLVRYFGFMTKGYNIIQSAGPVMSYIAAIIILLLAAPRWNMNIKSMFISMTVALSIYYLLSTTVHPWYLLVPLSISLFTPLRFPLAWTLAAFLSYHAYSHGLFHENLLITVTEYILVLMVLITDIILIKKKKSYKDIFRIGMNKRK